MAIKKAQKGAIVKKPTYSNLGMARSAENNKYGRDTDTPATKQDSALYRSGYKLGQKGIKPSAMQKKFEGENEYQKMGRWEGQNTVKKVPLKKGKTGIAIKKAQNGKKVLLSEKYHKKADSLMGEDRRKTNEARKVTVSKDPQWLKKATNLSNSASKDFKTGSTARTKAFNLAKKGLKNGGTVKKCKTGCK